MLALLDAWGLAGEIQIWQGGMELPEQDSRLMLNFASQIGHVLARTHQAQADAKLSTPSGTASNKNN